MTREQIEQKGTLIAEVPLAIEDSIFGIIEKKHLGENKNKIVQQAKDYANKLSNQQLNYINTVCLAIQNEIRWSIYFSSKLSFIAGAESRQPEIDELKAEIDELVKSINSFVWTFDYEKLSIHPKILINARKLLKKYEK